MSVAKMRLKLIEQLLRKNYCKYQMKLLLRGVLQWRLQRTRPRYINKCLIYFGWVSIYKQGKTCFLNVKLYSKKNLKTYNYAIIKHPFRQSWIQYTFSQKIKFAIDLEQLRNVVNKTSGDYLELALGVTTKSEFVAVVYSNSKDAQAARIVAFGKACPPSTKCPPTN